MKILSIEESKDIWISKNILIPCRIYEVPARVKKNNKLNLLEESIYKLKQINNYILDDIEKLKKYLGFYSEDEQIDANYTDIIKTAIQKIKDYRLDEEEDEEIILTFYQETYTGKLLPIVINEIQNSTYEEKNSSFNGNSQIRKIEFKKSSKDTRLTTAYWYSTQKNQKSIEINDLINAVNKHNLKQYKNFPKIDVTQILKKPVFKEEVLLHTKVYFLENGEFVLTNGFSGDFSSILTDVFRNYEYGLLIKELRKTLTQKIIATSTKITIPYKTTDNTVKEKLEFIEMYLNNEENNIKSRNNKKEKLTITLFDLIEYSLKIESDKENARMFKDEMKNESFLVEIAKTMGFEANERLNIFHISQSEGIKVYIALLLINKSQKLKQIAKQNPEFLIILNRLLYFRNALKHSSKLEILEKIDINEILEYKDKIYKAIEIILNLKKETTQIEIFEKKFSLNNSYIKVENSFDITIWQKMPQDIKDMLVDIQYHLDEKDFLQYIMDVINSVSVNLSAIFEYIFKNIYKNFHYEKEKIKKDDILKKYNISSKVFMTISNEKFESALKGLGASLGAYYLLYINFYGIEKELFLLIEALLNLRKHANITYEEASQIKKEELTALFIKSKVEINKLIKEKCDE